MKIKILECERNLKKAQPCSLLYKQTHTCTLVENKWLNASTQLGFPCTYLTKLVGAKSRWWRGTIVKQRLRIFCVGRVWRVPGLCLLCIWHSLVPSGASLATSSLIYPLRPRPPNPDPMHVHSGWHLQRLVGWQVFFCQITIFLTFAVLRCCRPKHWVEFALTFRANTKIVLLFSPKRHK